MPKFKKKVEKPNIDARTEQKIVEEGTPRKSGRIPKKVMFGLTLCAVVIVIGVGFYIYMRHQQDSLPTNPAEAAAAETQMLVDRVGKLILLPKNEKPTVATVTDKAKLADQKFFVNAENGDRVLLYGQSQEAILYRPAENKIINVAPLNVNQAGANPATGGSVQAPSATGAVAKVSITPTPATIKTTILNGTKRSGLTKTAEAKIESGGVDINVVTRGNATSDYANTTVVDLTGKNSSGASIIAKAVGGKVGSLPASETKPTGSDVLVILGADF